MYVSTHFDFIMSALASICRVVIHFSYLLPRSIASFFLILISKPRMLRYFRVNTLPSLSPSISPVKRRPPTQQCRSNGTSNIQNYVLLLNEWKMMFIVYFGVLFGAILINISVTYPSNLNSTLFNAMNSVPFLQSPVVQDLIVLAVSLLISIPLISWIVIPLLLKVTRKWVMDQIINVHELKSQSSRKWTCSEIMARGLIPIPNYILMDRDQFQSFPIKWKFAVLIYIAVLISEFVLWSFLYKHGLSKWRYTNIHQEIDIDVRLRFALFLTFDLLVSVPLIDYLFLPFFVNWMFPKWVYRTNGENKNCFTALMSNGFQCLEIFDANPLIGVIAQPLSLRMTALDSLEPELDSIPARASIAKSKQIRILSLSPPMSPSFNHDWISESSEHSIVPNATVVVPKHVPISPVSPPLDKLYPTGTMS